jgi:hypothetical protein
MLDLRDTVGGSVGLPLFCEDYLKDNRTVKGHPGHDLRPLNFRLKRSRWSDCALITARWRDKG